MINKLYESMLRIRTVEEIIIREYPEQKIKCPVHLCIGQEVIPSAISLFLNDNDYIVSNHRCHGHVIAKGLDLVSFFAELYGKKSGCTGGRGGSMHLCDMSKGIVGTSAIVGGGLPIATGLAYAQKIKNTGNIVVVYFGDGAIDEGVFWESINFADLKRLPIIFVYEDNGIGSNSETKERHRYNNLLNYLPDTFEAASHFENQSPENILKRMSYTRKGGFPKLFHFETHRFMEHVGVNYSNRYTEEQRNKLDLNNYIKLPQSKINSIKNEVETAWKTAKELE